MIAAAEFAASVRNLLRNPTDGVVGLVDELVALGVENDLQFVWQPDRCRVRTGEGDWEELSDVSLRKSVFRAILARVATLCNEFAPDSVSPYGGAGRLILPSRPAVVVRVDFVNTPDRQELRIATTQN